MARFRLYNKHFSVLHKMARDYVLKLECVQGTANHAANEHCKLVHHVVNDLMKQVSVHELDVLRKFGFTEQTNFVLITPEGNHSQRHELYFTPVFDTIEIIDRGYNGKCIQVPDTLYENWMFAVGEHHRNIDKQLVPYTKLINGAKALEDIESIWPDASRLRQIAGAPQLPATLSNSDLELIKQHQLTGHVVS